MNIIIDKTLKQLTPSFHVAVIEASVKVKSNTQLDDMISNLEQQIFSTIDIKDVVNLPIIIDGRNAYKTYGKDPSRYRLAVESLYRRLAKGSTLYRINNVVDLGNVLSIETRKSVAVLDMDKIEGDIRIRLGNDQDVYEGIGRGTINIENIPLYEDRIGPFGSVTSDTPRTMITDNTKRILLFIISFSGKAHLEEELNLAKELYQTYADGVIEKEYIL